MPECTICPNNCKVNRKIGEIGICKATDRIKVALSSLHYWEEPCISGKNGSGTIFFSNCNMKCKFCQNYKISQEGKGKEVTIEELANIFLSLQEKKANNINLVTPTIYAYQIIEAIKIAKCKGLVLPIIYNSNGYENVQTIKDLNGYIDVYLPDLKYYYDDIAIKYSGVKNYFENASLAIMEMYKQVGSPILDKNGIIKKGLIIRHLVLPNHIMNSKMVLKRISKNINKRVLVSVMSQYFPTYKAMETEDINRKLSEEEYNEIKNTIEKFGINGYFQDMENNEEKYVPNF